MKKIAQHYNQQKNGYTVSECGGSQTPGPWITATRRHYKVI